MLTAGSRLGPYEITAPLGAGGMGEVYRARDTRLDRTVAIKILPPHLASSSDLKQRFEREAKAISSLQHPHICTLFDVGSQDGVHFLVMEYLEGETLAERLVRGPLKADEAVKVAIEIAEALDRAHRQGIVHRDLKPGNVMLTKSGAKLMDFGLAKPALARGATASDVTPNTPTMSVAALTSPASPLTEKGMIVGTVQYMAPEVLQGQNADARSDIFSFGCMLYEMVTGRRAFDGQSQISVLSAILEKEPEPIATTQPMSPRLLDVTVRNCLRKDPDERYASVHDIKLQLGAIEMVAPNVPGGSTDKRSSKLGWVAAAIFACVAALMAWSTWTSKTPTAAAIYATIPPPPNSTLLSTSLFAGPVEISPDGTKIVFAARQDQGPQMLWVRRLDEPKAKPLRDSEGGMRPFWSPDSKYVGFFTDTKLRRVNAEGGPVLTMADVSDGRGATWSRDGVVLYAPVASGPLMRVNAEGGKAVDETKLDTARGDDTHRYPWFLPDQKHFLVLVRQSGAGPGNAPGIFAGELGKPGLKRVVDAASNAVYSSGYLLYVRDHSLVAQKFDVHTLQVSGEPVSINDDVRMDERFSRGVFSASANGTLVFQTGAARTSQVLQVVDRTGSVVSTVGQPDEYFNGGRPQYTPDGKKAAAVIVDLRTGQADVWEFDLRSGSRRRITTGTEDKFTAALSPDGNRIAYCMSGMGTGQSQLMVQALSGTSAARMIFSDPALAFVDNWSADGKYVLMTMAKGLRREIVAVPAEGGDAMPVVRMTNGNAQDGQVSPDGKFIGYESDESGRPEIYVASFPKGHAKWQVSQNGGVEPRWRRDGKELYFFAPDNELMAAQVTISSDDFQVGNIERLFQSSQQGTAAWRYDVASDGQHFLVTRDSREKSDTPITVITNWTQALTK